MLWKRGDYEISTDPGRIDLDAVHAFLSNCYWAAGIPKEVVERSIRHSLPFGVYHGDRQIGFARIVTDRATFAYIADVYILPEHRKLGLSKWLMKAIAGHPDLQNLRRWVLVTKDAHGLYTQSGFAALATPARFMEKIDRDVYEKMNATKEA